MVWNPVEDGTQLYMVWKPVEDGTLCFFPSAHQRKTLVKRIVENLQLAVVNSQALTDWLVSWYFVKNVWSECFQRLLPYFSLFGFKG